MKASGSPLLVWELLAVIVLAGIVGVLVVDPTKAEVTRRKSVVSSKLDGIQLQPGELSILFFGNSLLRQALTDENTLSKALTERLAYNDQNRVRVINLTFGGASARYLQTVADQIIALHPKVIVMQIDMIAGRGLDPEEFVEREQAKKEIETVSSRFRYWSGVLQQPLVKYFPGGFRPSARRKQLLNPLLTPTSIGIPFLRNDEQDISGMKLRELNLRTAKKMWEGQTLSTTQPSYGLCRKFIRKAVDEGITVIVVQTPIGTTVKNIVPKDYFEQRTAIVRKIIKPKLRPPLQYPRVLPDDCFKDYSHVNRKGQRLFLQWFIPALALEISSQE